MLKCLVVLQNIKNIAACFYGMNRKRHARVDGLCVVAACLNDLRKHLLLQSPRFAMSRCIIKANFSYQLNRGNVRACTGRACIVCSV